MFSKPYKQVENNIFLLLLEIFFDLHETKICINNFENLIDLKKYLDNLRSWKGP